MNGMWLAGALALALATGGCGEVQPTFEDAGPPDVDGDVGPPETMLTAAPPELGNVATVSFGFRSEPDGAMFLCSLDGAEATGCASPHGATVGEGVHTFAVAATTAGGEDPTPATASFTVDLTPPDTSITMAPPSLDNSAAVSVDFAADEAATFTCRLDGGAVAACVAPHALTGLADGPHQLAIVATDLAGNVEPEAAVHAWTIDTSSPDTVIDSGPSGTVAATTAQFSFSSPDAGPGATYTCALDGSAFTACTSPRNLTTLSDREHMFAVRVRDSVGNVDPTPAVRTWVVDTRPPTVTITGGPTSATADQTPTFTFTTGGSATGITCRIDTAPAAPCTSPYTPAALADGNHTFRVDVSDAAGNQDDASRAFSVDTTPPTVTITSGPAEDQLWTSPSVTFGFVASDAHLATRQCRVYEIGTTAPPYTTCVSPVGYNLGSGSAIRNMRFQVRATDTAGWTRTATRNFRHGVPAG